MDCFEFPNFNNIGLFLYKELNVGWIFDTAEYREYSVFLRAD